MASAATAMELTGHKSLSVALRYQIADLARQKAGLERLEAHRRALGTRTIEGQTAGQVQNGTR